MEGDVRIIEMADNTTIKERVTSVDGQTRRVEYTVVEGLPCTVDGFMTMGQDGESVRVTWGGQGMPDDMIARMGGTYASGLQALKAHLER
jgi:hypothetical protein